MDANQLQAIAVAIGRAVAQSLQELNAPRIPLQLPSFDGKADLLTWLEELEVKFAALGINSDTDRIAWTKTALTGIALQYVQLVTAQNAEHRVETWRDLVAELTQRFVPKNQSFYLRDQLNQLKQKGNDIQRYLFEFNSLVAKLEITKIGDLPGKLSEVEKMYSFLQGLHPKTKQAMLQKNPVDFSKLVELVLIHEQAMHTTIQTNANGKSSSSNGIDDLTRQLEQMKIATMQPKTNEECSEEESSSTDEEVSSAMTESIQEANAITHKRNFRSQRKPFRKFNRNVKAKFKPQAKNGVCSRCLTPGHYAAECRRTYEECQKLKSQHGKQKGPVKPLKGPRFTAGGQL